MLSWLRLLLFLSFKLCRSTQFKVNFARPMNMGKSTDYESILGMADMNTLEHRRIEQSLMIFLNVSRRMVQAMQPIYSNPELHHIILEAMV